MKGAEVFEAIAGEFAYDPGTGIITRRGRPIGRLSNQGYIRIAVGGKEHQAHRVAWFLSYGSWPQGEIDHINGDRADNRLVNLRDVTACQNRMNQRQRSDNSSGITGVRLQRGRWQASICVRGQRQHLGTFQSREAAAAARLEAQRRYAFGPNHGARP